MASHPAGAICPVISESIISVPEQRLYALSIGVLIQGLKLLDVISAFASSDTSWRTLFLRWSAIDAVYFCSLAELRIPRLDFTRRARLMQILLFTGLNWILFGNYSVAVSTFVPGFLLFGSSERQLSINEHRVSVEEVLKPGSHLLGQHTIRLSPISTAILNPSLETFCLAGPEAAVLLPIVFNNSRPSHLQYSIAPLGDHGTKAFVELSAKELRGIEKAYADTLRLTHAFKPESDYDEDDDEDDDPSMRASSQSFRDASGMHLQRTESLHHIRITKPGVVRLERAADGEVDVRIRPGTVTVVECPTARFEGDSAATVTRCVGSPHELQMRIFGVSPLALKWTRDIRGRKESFTVEGIEAPHVTGTSGAQNLHIPLSLSLDTLGMHTYTLDEIIDGIGNAVSLPSTARAHTSRSIAVLRRASMSFRDCAAGRTITLLKGQQVQLKVTATESDDQDGPWDVAIAYRGHAATWQKTFVKKGKEALKIEAAAPGEYTILSVAGQHCPGDVLNPDTCRVVEQPLPSAQVEWQRIHECSGDTGVSAQIILQGVPPFHVVYAANGVEHSRNFASARNEITLQPERDGRYRYAFMRLSDAHYKDLPIADHGVELVIHRLAAARFARAGAATVVSCDGNSVDVDVKLEGSGPWNLEVQIAASAKSETHEFRGLKKADERLTLPIPPGVNTEGGTFQVDLVSVEDSHGCRRRLSVAGVTVTVKRVKPTAKFYAKDGKRQITTLQSREALLPLRLTGDGPWKVKYRKMDKPDKLAERQLTTANAELMVQEEGLYELVQVHDKHCPGTVSDTESVYQVDWIARPSVTLSSSTEVTYIPSNGSHVRRAVCEGVNDHVDLDLKGRAPFQLLYNVARESEYGTIKLTDQASLNSIQHQSRFQLDTSTPGRVYYEVIDVGDASYPLAEERKQPHHMDRLQFEQEVLMRPSAQFKNTERMSYCLGDSLVSRDTMSHDGTIALTGTPPFVLSLLVKNLGSSEVHEATVHTSDPEWKLDVPEYVFKTVGQHLVTIESVFDAHRCDAAPSDPARRSLWINVAETAAIVPYDRRMDFCVGEVLQFQLEGTPPWRVKYRFNGKTTTAAVKASPFKRVADKPGVFSIASIAHQQNMCQTTVDDLHVTIHDIPSAQVSHGKKVIEDIREGEQAEIVFTLIGEPPFTFTYQRAELAGNQRLKHPKILETHTVSGIMTREYSILATVEGTWTVTFIADKFCRYPPAQVDMTVEKA